MDKLFVAVMVVIFDIMEILVLTVAADMYSPNGVTMFICGTVINTTVTVVISLALYRLGGK